MSCIHFKFKSSLEYEKLSFNGLQISVGDLKEAIMKQKKIGGANQYTLSVKDAQSKKSEFCVLIRIKLVTPISCYSVRR